VVAEGGGRIEFFSAGAGGSKSAGGEAEGEAGGDGEDDGDEHDDKDGVEGADGGLGYGGHGASCRWELYRRLLVKLLSS
jgi:hypothetical protein